MLQTADSCSSRSTPKPRPPAPTTRPNITFQTYACPEAYAKWYCLNGATCFSVRIGESILYNCECANGYMGQRCEFKDLEGSYPGLPSRETKILEAGLAGGILTLGIVLVFVISLSYYTYLRNQMRTKSMSKTTKLESTTPLLHSSSSSLDLNDPFIDSHHPNPQQHHHYHHHHQQQQQQHRLSNDDHFRQSITNRPGCYATFAPIEQNLSPLLSKQSFYEANISMASGIDPKLIV
ncbi:PAX-interacting protein 1 [Sarcoptes scabiei]|nr:PAX-interacting protein 1 [Sarcoptes scabiei]